MGAEELVRIVDLRRPRHVEMPILVVEDDPHLRGMPVLLDEGFPRRGGAPSKPASLKTPVPPR